MSKMFQPDLKEIQIFDDEKSDNEIMKSIIAAKQREDAFYILDIADVVARHKEWMQKMPRVTPHFAIKCNPNTTVIKILAMYNAGFDCASEEEIKQVMQYGVSGDRIIFANPAKCPSHIKFAKKVGVSQMTVDSEIELLKIKDLFPKAKIVIRIRCDAEITGANLGSKYGCEPNDEAIRLIECTKELGLTLHGFSFHVGSPCGELNAYARGIEMCKQLIAAARSIGCTNVRLIDIGGGIPGETGENLDRLASIINTAIQDIDPSITIISEPGRYYVTSPFKLAAYLHTKKLNYRNGKAMRMYYINAGVYTSFIEELLDIKARHPASLFNPVVTEKFLSTIWGPTCDSYDCIIKDVLLPDFDVGDWLVWTDMGAYSICLACSFNGFAAPDVYPIMRKSQWKSLCDDINLTEQSLTESKWVNTVKNGTENMKPRNCLSN